MVLKPYVVDCEIQMLDNLIRTTVNKHIRPIEEHGCGPIDKNHSFCDYVASFDNALVLLRVIRFGFNHGWFDSDDAACSDDICRILSGS